MRQREATSFNSYFGARLAERASSDEVAAPVTYESLAQSLATYLDEEQIAEVRAAYEYAAEAHEGQVRQTGHPYITHPLAVASILAGMHMDHPTLMAALLHDVIEDTGVAKRVLGKRFGKDVAEIVDGVSKLTTIFRTRAEAQAENFQKMAIAMSKDLRVVLVKLADRLHNMRTIGVLPPEKRREIARETLDFYAPIANRLGIHTLKIEIEDLAFQALYPLRADRIQRAVSSARGNRKALMEQIQRSLATAINREGIDATVGGREKHLYSIYEKMRSRRKPFNEIMDVFGFRIVCDRVDTCYRVLGVVHNLYKPVAGRFKDYIAIPKANGYQSLHTTLFGMHGVPIEVQIRTRQMDAIADNGIAGHWLYKSDEPLQAGNQARARQWVRDILDLQQRAGSSLEFIESLKIDLFPDEVYVFSPRGDIYRLPRGACAVDFAYAVHTDVGNSCVACRIERNLAPLSSALQNGQTVEIITAKDARPNPDWLTFAVSGKARTAIRQALKAQKRSQSIALGRRLLNRSLAHADLSINDLDFKRLRMILKEFNVRRLNDLLEAIGLGNYMAYVVAQRLLAPDDPTLRTVSVQQGGAVAIRGSEGLVISYARCCYPVPGDPIVGHMSPEKGFVVHIETCKNMAEIRRRNPNEIIPARWSSDVVGEYLAALRIHVDRQKGVIAELAAMVNEADAGIDNVKVDERNAELSTIVIEIYVRNRTHLAHVMRRLRSLNHVHSISRTI
jgi:GTP diphosphokinase / guanosine-3',5'-bis(diphosphate) 3'-diphosphatase